MGFNYPATLNGNAAGQKALYGRYMLGAQKNSTTTTPLANFLTRDMKVKPGNQFDSIKRPEFGFLFLTISPKCGKYSNYISKKDESFASNRLTPIKN